MKVAYKSRLVLTHATNPPMEGAAVVVENGQILSVAKKIPKDTAMVDLGDVTLMPGLIDVHAHLMWSGDNADPDSVRRSENSSMGMTRMASHARRSLMGGITTLRDTGSPTEMILAMRRALEIGILMGPRVVSAGTLISMTGGHVHTISREADGPDEVRKAARELIKSGVDFLKLVASGGIYGHGEEVGSLQSELDELSAAVKEAHKAGKKTAVHVYPAKGIEIALDAGIDSIEHGSFLTDELAIRMAKRGNFLVPTLSVFQAMFSKQDDPSTLDYIRRKTALVVKASQQAVKIAKQNGVKIGAGTDSGGPWHPHGSISTEILALVKAGLTPSEALNSATLINAEIIGLENEIGSIEPGKRADLIAVKGNPIDDINSINKISLVVKKGAAVCFMADYAKILSAQNLTGSIIL